MPWSSSQVRSEIRPLVTAEHKAACIVISHPHVLGALSSQAGGPTRLRERMGAPEDSFRGGTQNVVCYVGRMDRFIVPAAASIVVGLLLGAAAISV